MTNTETLEKSVLATLLVNTTLHRTKEYELLTVDSFSDSKNSKIFESIQAIVSEKNTVDLLILVQHLKKHSYLDYCGGVGYISSITSFAIPSDNFEIYVLKLLEERLRSKIVNTSTLIQSIAISENNDVFDVLNKVNEFVENLNSSISVKNDRKLKEIFKDATKEIEQRKTTGLMGISSGIKEVDERIKGWSRKELHILAGRPGMGKTTFSLSMFNKMVNNGLKGAFFSLEMSDTSLAQKLIAIHGNVPSWKISNGYLNDKDWLSVNNTVESYLSVATAHIFDNYYTLESIVRKVKELHLTNGLDFVMIDYLQLISLSAKKGNREQEISTISRTLKNLATDLNIPIIALSQLSRAVEQRGGDKRPLLSDLRESGSLEQDASTVSFCYRPSYYGMVGDCGEDLSDKAYLILAKHRNSELKDIELFYNHKVNQEWRTQQETLFESQVKGGEFDNFFESK